MNLEIAGVLALGAVFVGAMIASPPQQDCAPVEVIRWVRSEPEIRIKEVEKIIEKPAVCTPVEEKAEQPVRRHRRRHFRRWR